MKIHISPFTYLFYALMLLFNHNSGIIASFTAVAIHEAAHLTVITLCGCTIEGIEVTPIGLTIRRLGVTAHIQDAVIHLAGPFANLITAGLLFTLFGSTDPLPISANLFFGLLNLLPIDTLDGGKAFASLLSIRLSDHVCRKACRWLSNCALLALWMLSAASLLMLNGSPSLLFFCIGLFGAQMSENT